MAKSKQLTVAIVALASVLDVEGVGKNQQYLLHRL